MTQPAPHQPCALVVDDDVLIRMAAVDILGQAGFRVLDADHGDAAYKLLTTRMRGPDPVCCRTKARFIAKPFSAELVHAHVREIPPDAQKPEPLK